MFAIARHGSCVKVLCTNYGWQRAWALRNETKQNKVKGRPILSRDCFTFLYYIWSLILECKEIKSFKIVREKRTCSFFEPYFSTSLFFSCGIFHNELMVDARHGFTVATKYQKIKCPRCSASCRQFHHFGKLRLVNNTKYSRQTNIAPRFTTDAVRFIVIRKVALSDEYCFFPFSRSLCAIFVRSFARWETGKQPTIGVAEKNIAITCTSFNRLWPDIVARVCRARCNSTYRRHLEPPQSCSVHASRDKFAARYDLFYDPFCLVHVQLQWKVTVVLRLEHRTALVTEWVTMITEIVRETRA